MGDKQYGSVTLNILNLVFNFHKKTEKKIHFTSSTYFVQCLHRLYTTRILIIQVYCKNGYY